MTRSANFSPPLRTDGPQLADWAELILLTEGRERASRATLRRRLAVSAASVDEADLDLLVGEIARRSALAPASYPFSVTEAGLQRTSDHPTFYDFLLIASHEEAQFRLDDDFNEANLLFDLIAREALRCLVGSNSTGVRFEWRVLDGGPGPFGEALSWLADQLDIPEGNATRRAQRKDGGVDVVAWQPFRDGRTSYPLILAQCTLQMRYQRKGSDIELDLWKAWIRFGADPMTALVIPFVVPLSDDRWSEMRYTVSVIVDRMRLCELLEDVDSDSVTPEVADWIRTQVTHLAS